MVYTVLSISIAVFLLFGCGNPEYDNEPNYWPERVEKPVPLDKPIVQKQ
jgi:hypothetical protein